MEALKSKEEAAEALKTYAHTLAELGVLTSTRDKAVLEIQNKFQPGITSKSEILTGLKQQLEGWAQKNPKEFGEKRELELSYGFLRFRKGQRKLELLARWTWEKVIQKLEDFPVTSQWKEYVRKVPELDARKILDQTKDGGKLPIARLKEIGLKVTRGESFNIETKPEMIARDCDLTP